MDFEKSILREYETAHPAAAMESLDAVDLAPGRIATHNDQRALLNILDDFATEKTQLEAGQRAVVNILEDFDVEKARMESAQRALLNILEDSVAEKTQLEAAGRSVLNILDDFATEKTQLEAGQRAVVNILEDFDTEKAHMEGAQRAVVNILEDSFAEKTQLQATERSMLNILDDFEMEKTKVERVNQQLQKEVEERKRAEMQVKGVNSELLAANKELEAFSYSVSHDLRAPLRGIDGFSLALLEDYGDKLDEDGRDYLRRVRAATQRMGMLIDDLLNLSRVSRSEIRREKTDLGAIAKSIAAELQRNQPERQVEFHIEEGVVAFADCHLIRITLENLLGNAWKFTSKRESARIEFGRTLWEGELSFYVRDNGAGFNPAYANRLFGAFQRLHDKTDFPGTGVGLATCQRIVHRHGGRIWAESAVEKGATFYFTLPETTWRSYDS